MAQRNAFATVSRTFGYFRDLSFEKNTLYVRRTGARIKLNASFLRSSLSALEIYTYLVGVRISRILRGKRPARTIAFFPQTAAPWYNIWSVVQLAGLRVISDPDTADVVFLFEDNTYSSAVARLAPQKAERAVNGACANISKQFVADVFEQVFGYALSVDPVVYQGTAMRKSQHNGSHDGVVVECPIPANTVAPGFAYQKLIDTSDDGGKTQQDLRVAFVRGEIATVFEKYKATDKRFGTEYLRVFLRRADEVFSEEECKQIIEYCQLVGLDFGAVDILRSRTDGRIYIVDVNKTCMPVLSLPLGKQIEAYRRITDAFMRRCVDGKTFNA
ncbi:MAG: hypothetical protein AAF850_13275 [Pseudomonadota bacterium]